MQTQQQKFKILCIQIIYTLIPWQLEKAKDSGFIINNDEIYVP